MTETTGLRTTEIEDIMSRILSRHSTMLRSVGLHPDDARQSMWVRLLTKPPSQPGPAFLTTVLRTALLDEVRALRGRVGKNAPRKVSLLRAGPLPETDPERGAPWEPTTTMDVADDLWRRRSRAVRRALRTLTPSAKDAVLRVAAGASVRSVARSRGVTDGAVYQQVARGMASLRRQMGLPVTGTGVPA